MFRGSRIRVHDWWCACVMLCQCTAQVPQIVHCLALAQILKRLAFAEYHACMFFQGALLAAWIWVLLAAWIWSCSVQLMLVYMVLKGPRDMETMHPQLHHGLACSRPAHGRGRPARCSVCCVSLACQLLEKSKLTCSDCICIGSFCVRCMW